MNPPTIDPMSLPAGAAAAARQAAELLYAALRPAMTAGDPPAQVTAMWWTAKMLDTIGGGLDSHTVVESERLRERWEEAADLAASIVDEALTVAAVGLSPQQAAERLIRNDASDVLGSATAYTGVIPLIPPDAEETERVLTVTIHDDLDRSLSVTADRGTPPEPRPQTAATLLRTVHHLHRLAATLGGLVLEPAADGVPVCGRPDAEHTCGICQRTVGGDLARTVEVLRPWYRKVTVCSVTCARAAHAGEHTH
jgi:hypothetical protein